MGFESFLYDQVHRRYTLYDQNVKKQIGLGEAHPRPAEGSQAARVDEPPAIQFVTDGRGNVYPLVILRITPPSAHSKAFRQSKNGSNC